MVKRTESSRNNRPKEHSLESAGPRVFVIIEDIRGEITLTLYLYFYRVMPSCVRYADSLTERVDNFIARLCVTRLLS